VAESAVTDEARFLTPRQIEVLELVAKGLTNREIGGVLGIAANTVKVHVAAVISALDVTNRTEAAVALHELERRGGNPEESPVPGFGGRPAIAVLPFDTFSDDPEATLFADGLVDDLTTSLAGWRWFPVIARNTAFALRGKPIVFPQASRELGARYLVEGSARRGGDHVRINVQLIDGANGQHVFAEKYDRRLGDVLVVQDEIVTAIVGALAPALLRVEGLRALRKPAETLDAWESFQRGMALVYEQSPLSLASALEHFDRAIGHEPTFAPAYAGRSLALYGLGLFEIGATQFGPASAGELAAAVERAAAHFRDAVAAGRRASELDPDDASAHLGLGAGLAMLGETPAALGSFERAVELNPSSALACFSLANALATTDRWDGALPLYERAIRLSPRDPMLHAFEGALAGLDLRAGRYDEALRHAQRSVAVQPAIGLSFRPFVPAALAFLGRLDEARSEVDALRNLRPDWNLHLARAMGAPELVDRMVEGLRRAGWDLRDRDPGA
jgi:TolB-like protein/Flp pilus assembly protein TadD